MKGIMIQGCTSDAGKSYVATALCRILAKEGYKVCPFKSQNMANNSYVTWDGGEIGRAQGVQAEAAGIRAETYMNPILLKPQKGLGAEVVLFGEVLHSMPSGAYKEFAVHEGMEAVRKSLARIGKEYDTIVIEGAGSCAEVNLNDREIVNMRIAREADVPVLLVVDVNRGGSFASVVGTLELLGEDRKRIKGIIFNQFRGNVNLFQDGVCWIENYTGVKVVGVLPHLEDTVIEGEDSLSINFLRNGTQEQGVSIGVVRLPYLSNHTDLEIFRYEPDVSVCFVQPSDPLDRFDALIIPGTKSTIGDLTYLESTGLADRLRQYPGFVFGICGGYQMMGQTLLDEDGVDCEPGCKKMGLGLLPLETSFQKGKQVGAVMAKGIHPMTAGMTAAGYEIHLGRSTLAANTASPLWSIDGRCDGAATADLKHAGSYLHNIFHNDAFRTMWLNQIRTEKGLAMRSVVHTEDAKEAEYDKLERHVRQYLDVEYILSLLQD